MQATFEDHKHSSSQQHKGEDHNIAQKESERLSKNEERRELGHPTEGGSAGRAQVASKDPQDFDTKRGGQGDHLPTTNPIM